MNPNKEFTYYASLIVEVCGLVEYIIDVRLKDNSKVDLNKDISTHTGKQVNVYWKMNLLRSEGYNITDNDMDNIRKVKSYRNMVAHNTESCIGELIDFNKTKDYFMVLGEILYKLGALEEKNMIL